MNILKSKMFFLISTLIIWIALIVLFGFVSYFSLAGFSLLAYVLCIMIFDLTKGENSENYSKQMFVCLLGFLISCLNVVTAFYLEQQGLLFKLFVALFSLVMIYVFAKMIKDLAQMKKAKQNI